MRSHARSTPGRFAMRGVMVLLAVAAAHGAVPRTSVPEARAAGDGRVPAGGVLRVTVPEAVGGKTVVGQLTVDRAVGPGFVTAFGCDDGLPTGDDGNVARSDLNIPPLATIASNRLIVEADDDGDVCLYTQVAAAMIIDLNATTFDTGIESFPNHRTDTRLTPTPTVAANGVLRVPVPEARGAKTVVGQLTVDRVDGAGYVAAYGCDDGLPTGSDGSTARSDLNYDGNASPVASNRLIVQADTDGEVCFLTQRAASIVVDVNGAADTGISSFANHRTDTRSSSRPLVGAGGTLRVNVPEARGGKTVIGQLTVDRADGAGFVTAYGCADGLPRTADGTIDRSDLNVDSRISPIASNRLIVKADLNGDLCFYTQRAAAIIVDANGVTDIGIQSFPNRRVDTRTDNLPAGSITSSNVPVYPPYVLEPALDDTAALTGAPVDGSTAARPILAVKVDNYGVASPQWSLDQADAIFEENVEGVTRFVALFQTRIPVAIGPVRSARVGDLDLLSAMNRPIFAFSGANAGVTEWIASAARSEVIVDFSALHSPCYSRSTAKPGPHNLVLDGECALAARPSAGPGRPLWAIDAQYVAPPSASATSDATFHVTMDGRRIDWTWDPASSRYLRTQDGQPHLTVDGTQIAADTVVQLAVEHTPSPVDSRSPNPATVGYGAAIVHRDGRSIPAQWYRATAYDGFVITDAGGTQVPMDVGTTFVELQRDTVQL